MGCTVNTSEKEGGDFCLLEHGQDLSEDINGVLYLRSLLSSPQAGWSEPVLASCNPSFVGEFLTKTNVPPCSAN